MAQVTLTVNGQAFEVSCRDGEETRLHELAAYIDGKMSALAKGVGAVADSRLSLMTALVLADELFESRDREKAAVAAPSSASKSADPAAGPRAVDQVAEVLNKLTRRIENIAARIEGA